jgi:hypothetical protein
VEQKKMASCNPILVSRLREFPVKTALLILFTASALIGAEPDAQQEEKLYLNKFEPQERELDGYSLSESSWKDNKNNSAFERHLVSLMRVEVRLWGLQEYLRTGARGLGEKAEIDGDAADAAGDAVQIIHSEILDAADKALTMLRGSPNRPLTQLLIHHLENYPYNWTKQGWEHLIPNLRKLVATPTDKPQAAHVD